MSCKEISADWAAQRIKGLSLGSAIKNALLPQKQPKDNNQVIKTLINSFKYPRKGPGMMWEACAEKTQALGGKIDMGCKVVGCDYDEADFDLESRVQGSKRKRADARSRARHFLRADAGVGARA